MKMQKKLIKNEILHRQIEEKMYLEIGCLNALNELVKSPFSIENLFKFKENPRWELMQELAALDKELAGHLKHLRTAAEAEIQAKYDQEYFDRIAGCFEDAPRGLRPEDIALKGKVLSYSEPYRTARLAAATLELSEQETELYTALCDARSAANKLRELCGSSLWTGDLESLLFSEKDTAEVGFNYLRTQRIRKSLNN